ncbi:hypothetical protein MPER_07499 [Moniliophthora perniciosa FA553]|nr:hypothetical protein MPER_07499 [Moniliophthora perniciosa FA553]
MKSALLLISFISFPTNTVIASTNFSLCLAEIIQNNNNSSSQWFNKLLDHNGVPVSLNDTSRGRAISYKTCVDACGYGQEPFQWSTFSQEFSAWLLPYLALLSQLPFCAQDKLENLSSVLATLGSPTLAAFSFASHSQTTVDTRFI